MHTSVNKKAPTEINHHLTPHSLALQRSNYICIDNDISKDYLLGPNSKQFMKVTGDKALCNSDFDQLRDVLEDPSKNKETFSSKNTLQLSLRFCPMAEVNKKRQLYLKTQA